jgi:hypothetical protein
MADVLRAAAELPDRLGHLELTDAVERELGGGERDVFTAAELGPTGRPAWS